MRQVLEELPSLGVGESGGLELLIDILFAAGTFLRSRRGGRDARAETGRVPGGHKLRRGGGASGEGAMAT